MLRLIQSNQMEVLSEQLSKVLAIPLDNANLLANEHVLVQSPGMSTWLRLEVAKYNGIAAALSFPLPSSFTWQLCHELLPNVPKDNAFTKAAMTWKLMDLLPRLLTDEDFAPLQAYLTPEVTNTASNVSDIKSADLSSNTNESIPSSNSLTRLANQHQQHFDAMKLYQLCGRIADIFDQYLVYRPSWILGWESNELPIKLEQNQLWQPKLWRALIEYNQVEISGSHYHRANLHQELINALKQPQTVISSLPERLFVFGISSMPPQTLEVLYHLAERIEVIMFSLSPCQHYWGDIVDPKARARMALQYADKKQLGESWEEKLEVGNPILANNGKMGRELLDLMLELPAEHTDFSYDCYIEPEQPADELNLLQGLQFDILQMETLGQALGPDAHFYQNTQARRSLLPTDDSITLRSCHSPLREIETLHDHLLALLSNDQQSAGLLPKDIVVMMPDVAAYAPYIDAVFGTSNSQSHQQQGNYYIPYAIADRGAAQESPLINSFLNLLDINQSRFGLTDILSILEVPAILRKFQLDDDGLQLIRRWLDDANVRWGRDEHTRLQQGVPGFKQNSWAFGISRLIQGYAFNDESSIYHDTLLVKGVEGQSAQTLGHLLNFLESIDDYQQQLASTCPTLERIEQLYQLLEVFFEADDDEREQVQTIREALTALKEELEGAGHQGELDIEVLKQWFNQRLNESRVGQRYLAGSVNFCTLMPMRSIPFKVVCLLGMNDGVYPRVQHPVGFDLMAHNGAIKGDRSRRLDDRYLFLEALLSARQQLYISYIGHSERDNAERIPSMLVSELIEYYQLCYFADYCFNSCNISNSDLNNSNLNKNTARENVSNEAADQAIIDHLIIQQPLQPFDVKLFQSEVSHSPSQQQSILQQSFSHQWCPPKFNDPLTAQWQSTFINASQPIAIDLQSELTDAAKDHQHTLELSALLRFFRSPAQFFLNRSLKVDFNLRIQADDNDEPFGLDSLERYKLQSALIDSALQHKLEHADIEFINQLKVSGSLPMKPFDDVLLDRYQNDIKYVIGRVQYLTGEAQKTSELDVDLRFDDICFSSSNFNNSTLNSSITRQTIAVNLVGRIDDIYAKGQVNYRPGTAHGRDFLRVYLRHLCLNASGVEKNSYLLDIGHFHAFTAIKPEAAQQLLQQFVQGYFNGQALPLCFMPRTALAYVEAEGSHSEKLHEAQSQWLDEQTEFGEGNDPHNKRLFNFPNDFTEQGFGDTAMQLLKPMLSVYHKGTLADLDEYINETTSVNNIDAISTEGQA
ncbi:exodeoxyribonuclease V subunit gamma [Shewanella sp. 1_MG-2023]|uniref:exodeoxyribonuclease V subunit gamma n=1 Tax=unclassified Shewanella TaxID=196818 RepID=UPI0026E1FBB0|nr:MULTISPECIES: exodeoxyribonuclease V subunit gamma [unclassified Shewanella]MDO6612160.1 exodeoxyribonuclease V subunit gamma [Shewanella sp. 7_MG-2023]MDO6772014.1 exodeoxyribonuclease V subunit gamma [Shewanella sp. 2_MG-2023]MDO6795754.1 exodeoxyribonuclease V subunit gamma [Shewanella sp. 1_MG-2023]